MTEDKPYISRKETICNLINMAKHDEKKAIKFYKELRDKVPPENKSLAEEIEEIMKDEEDHYEKLIEILNECIDTRPRQPTRLPVVTYKGQEFYVDERLSQIRNVKNPHEFYDIKVLENQIPKPVGGHIYLE